MYDFHYNFIKKLLDAELLFTDTDSLTYEYFFEHKCLCDLSNYPKDSKFYDPVNEKFIGKMKGISEGKLND